ncbi:spore gernimation protein GerPD [Heyndrickxia ginsengihumi]|uniref:Spore gernimation protein GerPD n=1 Tax=Heyndrickxia ginsengihumi TaxID=363870 RepID=A0A0A6VGZ9_9BACI|nr:spore gernimation protein GerPD [Heyndrickxia ginsengihumi]KHD85904.1 spore gernimation protein GerPD [Heyndrickxia ginsengihumi]MBE6184904.1 spore gernimation protein GerPD [Bacillus sp. (in: firmicutes)]MCM3023590.1 spore gernimation protein GerPD [Heyndrickxia ginsengihumi]NEY18855.1 spore gernimation protein GerPD [Heyndrickxia ginsengihumi]
MELNVVNREINVEQIEIIGVSASSVLLVGDVNTIQQASTFDTPAESLIIGPFVPLARRG